MDVVRQLLLVLHIVGIGSLLGGFLTQVKGFKTGDVRIVPAMTHGALTMLVTGVALVGVRQGALDLPVDNTKIGVKLAILVGILLMVWTNRAKDRVDVRIFGAIGLLTVANIAIAVMWT
ncbi:hypothetical protein [Yinghuangia soli]|uniref:Uncharacterized protein n=1 Tax=Yinghuangia soli TaxID=2908204 RepID=A0AA41U5J9_9ACTN|nr:hypothetical protein [Yinghuangia soli]MCF2530054.1 hypothetical protein [Yinghuangia soli]